MQVAIAVVQFEIEPFAVESNIARAERFIQEAVEQRAGIIVFPEDLPRRQRQGSVNEIVILLPSAFCPKQKFFSFSYAP